MPNEQTVSIDNRELIEDIAAVFPSHYIRPQDLDHCACGEWVDGPRRSDAWEEHLARAVIERITAGGFSLERNGAAVADEYTPSTETVRAQWTYSQTSYVSHSSVVEGMEGRFDRWLSAHDATIRTEQAERDARIAETGRCELGGCGNVSCMVAAEVAAAIRDAAKEEQ